MPYKISKQGDKYCVVKETTGKSVGCHPSRKEADKQLAALYANEPHIGVAFAAAAESRGRWEIINGSDHFVVPIVAMVQGVIQAMNAKNPEFVSADQLSTYGWDERPVFINHPMVDGAPVASFHPKVAGKAIGFTRNPRIDGEGDARRLCMEVCIEKLKMTPELLAQADDPEAEFNVSMGAFINSVKKKGEYKGKAYASEWHDIDPDHMALLPMTKGACSWEMGCGIRAAQLTAAWMNAEGEDDHGRGAAMAATQKAHNSGKASDHAAAARAHENAASKAAAAGKSAAAAHHRSLADSHNKVADKKMSGYEEAEMEVELEVLAAEFLVARNISQETRDKLDKADFAGPNESFPIVEAADVEAAAHALGRAKGNRADIKRRIIAIAYRKGFEASLPEDWKKKSDQKTASKFAQAMAKVKQLFGAVDANVMSDRQLEMKLHEALREVEPNLSSVTDYFPVMDPTHVVYSVYVPSSDPMVSGDWNQYERSFTVSDAGVITLSDTRIEVETVVTYEPVEGTSPTAAEARVAAAPCGCKGSKQAAATTTTQEATMEKKDRVKALIAASNGMFTDGDQTMLEGATDEQLARYEAAAKSTSKTIADAAASVTAAQAAASAKPETATFDQLLAAADKNTQAAIKGAVTAAAEKKSATITQLIAAGERCKFSKETLETMDQAMLDNLVVLAGVKVAVDHSLILPPAAVEGQGIIVAQTNEAFNEKVKAARAKK